MRALATVYLAVSSCLLAWGQPAGVPVTSVAISPDGKSVAAGYADGFIRVFEAGERTRRWQTRSEVPVGIQQLAISPDSRLLGVAFALQGTWRNVRLYDLRDGRLVRSLGVGAAVAFAPKGNLVAVGGPGGVLLFDTQTSQVVARHESAGLALSLAFDSEGKRLAFVADGALQLVEVPSGRRLGSIRVNAADPMRLAFTADNKVLAAGLARSGQIFRWNLETGEAMPTLTSKFAQPVAVSMAPDGSAAAFVGVQNEVDLFDLAKGERVAAPRLGGGYANALGTHPQITAVGTLDGQVRWAARPTPSKHHGGAGVADAVFDAVIRTRSDVMYATTVLGAPVRVIQVDLKRPGVRVGIQVAEGFPTGDEPFEALVRRSGAEIAITGTFFDTASLRPVGDLVHRGEVLYRGHMGTALALTPDNEPTMRRVPFGRTQDWSAFEFVMACGPALVLDGEVDVDPGGEGFRDPSIFGTVPRVGVGFTADRRLLLVATGPLSFQGFARVMQRLECTHAMNLDAGSSRALFYRGQYLIRPGRQLTNILTVDVP